MKLVISSDFDSCSSVLQTLGVCVENLQLLELICRPVDFSISHFLFSCVTSSLMLWNVFFVFHSCTACVCEHSCPLPYPTTVGEHQQGPKHCTGFYMESLTVYGDTKEALSEGKPKHLDCPLVAGFRTGHNFCPSVLWIRTWSLCTSSKCFCHCLSHWCVF